MSCIHLEDFKADVGLESYEIIHRTIISPRNDTTSLCHEAVLFCFDCETDNIDSRLMACLHCVYFGCYGKHIVDHASSTDHDLSVELSNGLIICNACEDVVFDDDVEDIIKKCLSECSLPIYIPWKPSLLECTLLKQHGKRVLMEVHNSIGMRGLMNLGNTCFLNCMVQALLHTPVLRDYIFSERHKCYSENQSDCLFCRFSEIYQRYYSDDDPANLSLHEVLYLVWQNDTSLCEFGQKDVHEVFISFRHLLHKFSTPADAVHKLPCDCIVDSIFHGMLQSDLICSACLNVSTTMDPLWEVSLEIPESTDSASLIDCLRHYTRPEALGVNSKIHCSNCNSLEEGTKQLTFKLLPVVLVIHLKRFETLVTKRKKPLKIKKKSLFVSFPIDLDMTPFLPHHRNKEADAPNHDTWDDSLISGGYRYSLYAVVAHIGTLSGGHYKSYIRRTADKWFMCNDMVVEEADIEEVLQSEGYLLFYHKTILPYA